MTSSTSAPFELEKEKISVLLKRYAVPGIIAQVAASLYNMVDSIYIGHIPDVGSYALTGLAVSFPVMNLSSAMGMLVGVGAMTMISMLLGQHRYETANKVLANVLTLNTVIGIVFTVLGLVFLKPLLIFFGATENTLPFAHYYMSIIMLGNVITHLYFGLNGIIRAGGKPKTAMGLTLFTVISNAILDPVFIFGLGMGIRGAAIATVICQFMALIYTLRFFLDRNKLLHFPRPVFRFNLKVAIQSMKIGMGPFLMNVAASIVALFINQQLLRFSGDLAIGAYGIVNRIAFLFFMVCMGFNQGMQPIAGYNYGARLYGRVREIFFLTCRWNLLVTSVCFLVCELIPELAARMFTSDPVLLEHAVDGLRISCAMIFSVGFSMTAGNFFQCLGMVKISIFLSLSRQLIFLVPLIYLLPTFMGQAGVWWSFPIADVVSACFALYFILRLFKKIDRLKDGESAESLGSEMA